MMIRKVRWTPAAMRSVRAVRIADRPAGEGRSPCCRSPGWESFSGHSGRVGMDQRMAQNGAPTHEIERPGPLETGRRYGRPLHPRGVGRVGVTVSIT